MGTWNRRFNLGGLRFSAFDRISITISVGRNKKAENQIPSVRIGRQMKPWRQIGGINHHPPLRPRASPPLNIQRKNPLVAPTSLFSPASIHFTTSPKSRFTRIELSSHLATGASTSIALATNPPRAAFGI
ncbi:hypothetical protein N7449_001656 [Penicillium cf. viridicatum]|uniref:Uncharacterized protein n=1 Tax=Penicillium cf. viridicatum TaxID=2972119 RepID=A0A9W9T9F8_9EURO|nr:hypothetical protein N7449_001656 [Penicillium cf. viridicatum]